MWRMRGIFEGTTRTVLSGKEKAQPCSRIYSAVVKSRLSKKAGGCVALMGGDDEEKKKERGTQDPAYRWRSGYHSYRRRNKCFRCG